MATAIPEATARPTVREVARTVRGQPTSDGAGVRMTRVIGRASCRERVFVGV